MRDLIPETSATDMNMQIKHFILTDDGRIEEYSSEQAFSVASGQTPLPDFADSTQRYLQVQWDSDSIETGEIKVTTAGAIIHFDDEGRLSGAGAPDEGEEAISRFEFDTCVQLALQDTIEPIGESH